MATEFTRENVTKAFEDIIAQFGEDYRYEAQWDRGGDTGVCFYTHPEKVEGAYTPACIVGHVIHRLTPDVLQTIGALEEETGNSCGAPTLLYGFWNSWSDEDGNQPEDMYEFVNDETGDVTLVNAISKAQSVQDKNGTWGEAFAAYREYLALADQLD